MAFWKSLSLFLLISVLSVKNVHSRRFDRCSLARELFYNQGIPAHELSDWVCLAEHESTFNTQAMRRDTDQSPWMWGLFQVNDMYWCNPNRPGYHPTGNGCGINCQELVSDDITAAVRCAKHIRNVSGFEVWEAWRNSCRGRHYDLSDCGISELSHGSCYTGYAH